MNRSHTVLLIPVLLAATAVGAGCRQFTSLLYAPTEAVAGPEPLPDMGPVPSGDLTVATVAGDAVPPPPPPLGRGPAGARATIAAAPPPVGRAPDPEPPAAALRIGRGDVVEASHIVIEHILIAFDGANIAGVTRSREEARGLARNVLDRARRGEDFARLVLLNTDDLEHKGLFAIANWGVTRQNREEAPRSNVSKRFGADFAAAAFTAEPGEIVLVEQDPTRAPLGFHVLRRVR